MNEFIEKILRELKNITCEIRDIKKRLLPKGPYSPGQVVGVKPDGTIGWINGGGGSTDPDPTTFMAYWGWKDNNQLPTESEILAFPGKATFPLNSVVTANFSGAGQPRYLFMAEPISQPEKDHWYESEINQEDINQSSTIRIVGAVGSFRIYATAFQTDFNTVQFQKLS